MDPTKLNPLTLLDSLLADWVSPKVRNSIHTLILLVSACVALWLAVSGDWIEFVIALGGMGYAAQNRANTPTDTVEDYEDEDWEALHEDADITE